MPPFAQLRLQKNKIKIKHTLRNQSHERDRDRSDRHQLLHDRDKRLHQQTDQHKQRDDS